jgi:NTE family protein
MRPKIHTLRVTLIALGLAGVTSLTATPAAMAQSAGPPKRPRIALVLSGGGARGAAHVGVLKVLEELRVPVDCVVGTSMGSVVAGAYATGATVAEMEGLLSSVGLADVLTDEPPRQEKSIRRKEDDRLNFITPEIGVKNGKLEFQSGVVSGVGLEAFLRKAVNIKGYVDFDRLPIPYRAVATDLANGEMVVLRSGEVAQAMRASLAIPAVIAPANINGRLLVDGMVVRNIPVDVGRKLCGDVVIAVNVGTPLMKRAELTSLIAVAQQMVSILTEQNVNESLAQLTDKDVLITVDLEGFTVSDFDRMPAIAAAGEKSARNFAQKLARFSLPPQEYAALRARQIKTPVADTHPIDEIRVTGVHRVNPEIVIGAMETKTGDKPDAERLSRDMQRIYGSGDFEHVDYRLIDEKGKHVLTVDALEKAWGPNYLRFGLTLSSDFTSSSYFNLLGSYRATWLNSLGAEWLNELQVGRTNRLYTQFYQPLVPSRYFFVAPSFMLERTPVDIYSGQTKVAEIDERIVRGQIDVGSQFTRYGEVRLGVLAGTLQPTLQTGPPDIAGSLNRVQQGALQLRVKVDQLDSLNFPREGFGFTASVFDSTPSLGADDSYTKWDADFLAAYSVKRHTLSVGLKGGGSLRGTLPAYDEFSLGGFMQLSGFKTFQLYGANLAFGRLVYTYQLDRGAFFKGTYLGASLESGRVGTPLVATNPSTWQTGGSLFVAVDTPLGPVYLAYGAATGGNRSAYFFLGRQQ